MTRAQPLSCPYCGEPDLRPAATADTWHCLTCDRVWQLTLRELHGSKTNNGASA